MNILKSTDAIKRAHVGKMLVREVLHPISVKKKVKGNDYESVGKIPIIDQGQSFISGYTNDDTYALPKSEYVIFGEHTRVVKFVDFPFSQGADGIKILKATNDYVIPKYLFYALSDLKIPSRGYNRHWSIVKDMALPIPSIFIQREIVKILDKFTTLEAELEAELEARKKQYEFYRDKLLNNDNLDNFELKKVKQIFKRLKGTPITAGKMREIEKSNGDIKIFAGGKTIVNAFEKDIPNPNIIRVPAVLVQSRGVIDAIYYDKPFTFKNEMWAYTHKNEITLKYLYYVLKNNIIKLRDSASGMGSMPQISLTATEDLLIPIPPLEKQKEIVEQLDKFSKLCEDISEGLPAEIEARRKQYEYYRNKLLTFEESES